MFLFLYCKCFLYSYAKRCIFHLCFVAAGLSIHSTTEIQFNKGLSINQEALPVEQHDSYKLILTKAVESAWLHNATKLFPKKAWSVHICSLWNGWRVFRGIMLFIYRKVFIIAVAVCLPNEIWRLESTTCNITCEWRHLDCYTLLNSPSTVGIFYRMDYIIFKAPCLNVKKPILFISYTFLKCRWNINSLTCIINLFVLFFCFL